LSTFTEAVSSDRKWLVKQAAAFRRQQMRNEQVSVFQDVLADLLETEVDGLRDAVDDGVEGVDPWASEFYPEHELAIRDTMRPVVAAYGERIMATTADDLEQTPPTEASGFASVYTDAMAIRWVSDSRGQLAHLQESAENPAEAIAQRADRWQETRPQKVAQREATQAASGFAKHAFLLAGATTLVWVAGPDACPLCQEMDGRQVGITSTFMGEGDELVAAGEGGERRLTFDRGIGHPPLHGMGGRGGVCDCTVTAG